MRVAYGHKSTSLKLKSLLLCAELGMTPYPVHSNKHQIRLWHKKPHLKTILKDLTSSLENNKTGKTWVQNTKRNLDILVKGVKLIDNKWTVDDKILYRVAWINSMRYLKLSLHPPALKPKGNIERVTQEQCTERQLRDSFIPNFYNVSLNKSQRGIIKRGIAYLSRLQMGALPTTKERIQKMEALQKDCDLTEYTCPF
ncbi:putative signal peptide protein, partial [Puccinia sorghi]